MSEVFHVQAEDVIGNSRFSRYYTHEGWARRQVFQLRRDKSNITVGLRVLRGDWEEINV